MKSPSTQDATRLIRSTFWRYKSMWLEGATATILINLVALATSLFSMQVYDRVIPTQGYHTLFILGVGVFLSIFFELALKAVRSTLMDYAVVGMDSTLSTDVFARLLAIRLDQLPPSVGTLAAQLRSYEGVRALMTASTAYILVDVPFALVFIVFMGLLGTPVLALVPLCFLALSLIVGFALKRTTLATAKQNARAAHQKTGLLVEAAHAAPNIKASFGAQGMLGRWKDVNRETIRSDLKLRRLSEMGSHITGSLQQLSYAGLIAVGAWQVMEGHMTMGALIACSILSGRALNPAGMLPALMVQYAHAKAALFSLDQVYALARDDRRALRPENLKGHYALEDVQYAYGNSGQSATPIALHIPKLEIQPGDKIAILGPVGSGKSTLLKILCGLYSPRIGRVLLDDLALNHIDAACLARQVGYVQQDHRMVQGTLRSNLVMGLQDMGFPEPTDDALMKAARQTGLVSLIAQHPRGLDLLISEGGNGLSGGQRQQAALTRLLLTQARIWLLDEPTSSMDGASEQVCLNTLKARMTSEHTVVIVTHKPELVTLANRIIVMNHQQVVMDGARDTVLQQLIDQAKTQGATT
ncbi:MAG: ATP-binding cassette domain-containing protein [Cytophagales bacterium]|nr:ATP-binding cassette domain-containing protein [Cytophagales bacterium]